MLRQQRYVSLQYRFGDESFERQRVDVIDFWTYSHQPTTLFSLKAKQNQTVNSRDDSNGREPLIYQLLFYYTVTKRLTLISSEFRSDSTPKFQEN